MTGIALLLVGLLAPGPEFPSESFIRANYVKDDGPRYATGYPRVATNRFHRAGLVAREELSPNVPFFYRSVAGHRSHLSEGNHEEPFLPSAAFNVAVDTVLRCVPALSSYRDELFTPERIRLAGGDEIITYYLYRLRNASDPDALWVAGFVLLKDGACRFLPKTPEQIDIYRGGEAYEPWDLFSMEGSRFLLVQTHAYEARGMQLFRLDTSGIVPVLSFPFACLGCE